MLVAADESSIKMYHLRLSRSRVDLLPFSRPFAQLRLNALPYSLAESQIQLMGVCANLAKPGLTSIISFDPGSEDDGGEGEELLERTGRPATISVFRGSKLIISQKFTTISIAQEHHQVFDDGNDECNNNSLACFNNGCSLECFVVGKEDGGDSPSFSVAKLSPAEIPSGCTPVVMSKNSPYLVFNDCRGVPNVRHITFDGSAFLFQLVTHTYPNLRAPSIADLEVRMVGPASMPGFFLVVVGFCLLYRGGGRDLGALVVLNASPGANEGEAHVARWIDLRKVGDRAGNYADPQFSWLSCATTEWHAKIVAHDPRLRKMYSDTQKINNRLMETHGSLRSLLHPLLSILVVHDEEEC